MEYSIHPIQVDILLVLLFSPKARYKDLNTTNMSTDHFNFHVKRLLKLSLISKTKNGYYTLTTKGKEFANRFDTDKMVVERQAKVGVLVCCVKKIGGKSKYLIQQRLKEPYFGHFGFLTGKARWGETIKRTAEREVFEETGYKGSFKLVGVKHKMDYDKHGSLLEDKFFFVFKATDLQGKLKKDPKGGKNLWMTEGEISKIKELFDGVSETIRMTKSGKVDFSESKYTVSNY
ncbi:MAG: NUDIX hydrolase [Candidatus Woesebacteria bacterium]|jgi:ADP-ribose pyrophosphatase YjhB (NUDIX family)